MVVEGVVLHQELSQQDPPDVVGLEDGLGLDVANGAGKPLGHKLHGFIVVSHENWANTGH